MEYQRFCREPPNFLCLSIGSWGRARPRGRFQGNKGRLALSSAYAGPHRAWSRRTCARERIHTFVVERVLEAFCTRLLLCNETFQRWSLAWDDDLKKSSTIMDTRSTIGDDWRWITWTRVATQPWFQSEHTFNKEKYIEFHKLFRREPSPVTMS